MLLPDHFVVAHTTRGSVIRFRELNPDGPFALVSFESGAVLRKSLSESLARGFLKSVKIDELLDPFECLKFAKSWARTVSSPVSS